MASESHQWNLPIDLPLDEVQVVVDAIVSAGTVMAASYDQQALWDNQVFRNALWKLTWNHVMRDLELAGLPVWKEEGSLRFLLGGGFRCGVYGQAFGSRSPYDFEFNRTPKRKEAADANAGRLFPIEDVEQDLPDASELRHLLFTYCADPSFGTTDVHFGAPKTEGNTAKWAWVRNLYRLEDQGGYGGGGVYGSPDAPDEPQSSSSLGYADQPEVEAPDLRIREDKLNEGREDEGGTVGE